MPWGRCDDGFYRHGKVQNLRESMALECVGLYWLAISWCNDQLTDGKVPAAAVRLLGGKKVHALELVRVGLWEAGDDTFLVHDFLEFNKSKAQVYQERADAAERKAKSRGVSHPESRGESRGMSQSDEGDESPGDGGVESHARPVSRLPSPVSQFPEPEPPARDGLPHLDQETIRTLERVTGRSAAVAGDRQLTELDRLLEDHPASKVRDALVTAAGGKRATARQVVWGAVKVLEPFASPRDLERAEREADERRASEARFAATQRLIREQEARRRA